MKCPTCNVDLRMADRHGIEIDYCAQCRGIWLDRGELDKIIERASAELPQSVSDTHYYPAHDRNRDDYGRYHKKRKGFLGDLFDFD